MKRTQLLLVFLALLGLSTCCYAQNWSGIIAPTRAIDWSKAGVVGGIPNRTTICATLNPGASGSQINSAIASCPANQVVFLNAGTYNISGGVNWINKRGVTLRGAGPNSTILVFSSGSGCNGLGADVCFINGNNNYSADPNNEATWTGGYSQGSTSITFGSVATGSISNLQVGSQIILDQLNDTSDPGMAVYVCNSGPPCSLQGNVGNGRANRQMEQTVTVTSISGSGPWTIGITPGVYSPNYVSSKSPGAWWSSDTPVSGDGIENMTLNHGSSSTSGSGIMFMNAANDWVKNVRDINSLGGAQSAHVFMYQSSHNTVKDSYFYLANDSSESYGIDVGFGSSDNLIENNICQQIASCQVTEGSSGTVFAYNFAIDNLFGGETSTWQQEDGSHHSAGDQYILFEGNIGAGIDGDIIHGPSNMETVFRTRYSGRNSTYDTQQTNAIHLYAHSRFWNVVGNVLGTSGYHKVYEVAASGTTDSSSNGDLAVINAGYSGNDGSYYSGIPNDVNTPASLLLWGNYDTVNAANRFVAAEVPSGISLYANPVPASQSLPASLYLSSKPAFWGTMPWPAIGPDVTGGNIAGTGGHAYLTPAANCFLNIMSGSPTGTGSVLAFDANTCYVTTTSLAPNPPTNVQAIAQ